jgi:hypothetical protein
MDEIANFKRIQINNYFSSQCDLNEKFLDINQIKRDLHHLIGETPGVELSYETETLITEDEDSEPIKQERLNTLTVYYTYEVSIGIDENRKSIDVPRFDKVTYMI